MRYLSFNFRPLLLLWVLSFLSYGTRAQTISSTNIQSPSDFLGYELGTQWTPHYKVMDYVQYLADQSEMVTAFDYGTCLLYTSPSPRDRQKSRMPSSA